MCGIAGYGSRRLSVDGGGVLRAMADLIKHRGPDDEGYFQATAGNMAIGLAHRRLSIIDLDSGRQPLGNEDGSIQIVFNGEIYNYQALRSRLISRGHRFTTASDTETIVHAYEEYGEKCVEHLRGMFAFAIWDANRECLFLARDRFGKKPLYYYLGSDEIYFASEVKAILSVPGIERDVDEESLQQYLLYRYAPGPKTLFRNVAKLPPGTSAVWDKAGLRFVRYFSPCDGVTRSDTGVPEDPVGSFISMLDEAVKLRMISDVPFGAFLSGGLDSSAVVALMSRHSTKAIKTFSIGFHEAQYSEVRFAEQIARHFATDHHELLVSHDDLIDQLPGLIRFRDAPVSEPSDIPIYILASEASKHVKMVLTGEGSDEILGGYPKHVYERFVPAYQMIPKRLRSGIIEPIVGNLPYGFQRVRTAIETMGIETDQDRLPRWFGALSQEDYRNLTGRPANCDAKTCTQFDTQSNNSLLRKMLFFDQTSWLPDNLLERGDRMTMAASIEARMPFLDHELAAFVSSLPDRFRVNKFQTKWILRQAMRRVLPPEILKRPKVGFRVPVNEWFRGVMRDYLFDLLLSSDSRTTRYYRREELSRVLREHTSRQRNHEKLLWTLLSLEVWYREYFG
jgi:asparagine synthase (glutamine-hydrolysing)